MNALELLMGWFLLVSGGIPEPCNAVPTVLQDVQRQTYQVLRWDCGAKHFQLWQRYCPAEEVPGVLQQTGHGHWTRPFLLEETTEQQDIHLNTFGELVTGYHTMVSEVHTPSCGS